MSFRIQVDNLRLKVDNQVILVKLACAGNQLVVVVPENSDGLVP